MEQLQAAGIYVLFDLSGNDRVFDLTGSSPRRNGDPNVPVWTNELYLRYTRLIDAFQSYPNVLGAFIGTRVVQTPHSTDALVFLKAATRDIKAYIKEKKYRNIPIGYSGRFGTIVDTFLADYLVCGEESETIDFLGFEDFHWCGNSTFAASGYDDALRTFKGYARPVMISEYGCNSVRPRFQEVEAIYSSKNMTDVFSGGVAYEFYKNTDFGNFFHFRVFFWPQTDIFLGLVTEEGGELVENSDFSALSAQLALATPSSTAVGDCW
jgi:1,3-beta-glucanosyltransferase GAS1